MMQVWLRRLLARSPFWVGIRFPRWLWYNTHEPIRIRRVHGAAFVIYDYAITLGQEIEMFWRRKLTGATALFMLNRYLLGLDYIFNIATIERSSETVSLPLHPMH